ncbi:MAG: response regulator, partial [Mariprofundaceae bacterium]|nr:response regulator [Mariprofundaceae bacterium]
NAATSLRQQRAQQQDNLAEVIEVKVHVGDGQAVEIIIYDNGGGMDAATLQHCLDPFFTTQAVGQGTGLGLTSAMSYMQQLNGTLDIESIQGSHTTVRIRLPLVMDFIKESERGGLILLVDDDEGQRLSLEEVLSQHGYDVIIAEDGLQGLALWREHGSNLDAVVMDIVMPNMDGIEVARAIRKEDTSLPICLMTGYTYQRIPSSLHVNLMRKPFNHDLLVEYLQRTII